MTDFNEDRNGSNYAARVLGVPDPGKAGAELTFSAIVPRVKKGSHGSTALAAGRGPECLTIGIDGRLTFFEPSMQRGLGHYMINHLEALFRLKPDWKFLILSDEMAIGNQHIQRLCEHPNCNVALFDSAEQEQIDLFHSYDPMSMLPGYDAPWRIVSGKPCSVLFHDLIPLIDNEGHWDFWMPIQQSSYMSRIKYLADRNALVLSNSECTKADLVRLGNVPAHKIIPVMAGLNEPVDQDKPSAAEIQATRDKFGLNKPFFMFVGAADPHKNLVCALNAFVEVSEKNACQFVVVGGMSDPYKQAFKERSEQNGITNLTFTGYVERRELTSLYAASHGLVFPSRYEGFGFPVLEAMANGCPVITSNCSSLPEVAGDAAILVDPADVSEIGRGMVRLLNEVDLREKMKQQGLKQAEKFSWEITAEKTIEAWQNFAGANKTTRAETQVITDL